MEHADLISLAVPLAEIGAVIGIFIKLHTAPKFASLEAASASAQADLAAIREHLEKLSERLDAANAGYSKDTKALRSEVGEIVTKAHDRINPLEAKISAIEGWKEAQ